MTSNSFLYGKGIFTTIAIDDGLPVLWDKHRKRLRSNAEAIGLDRTSFESETVLAELLREIEQSDLKNAKARITLFDQRSSEIWPGEEPADAPTGISIIVSERRPLADEFRLTVSEYPVNSRSPLAGLKTCNYLEPILSLEEAKNRGFHEAIRLNERGHVTSACMANVLWEKDGELFTPALSTGCLAGTTREHVLENTGCREVEADIAEIEAAEAIFLTSAGLGIVRVHEFDGRKLFGGTHPIRSLWPPS